MLFLYFTVRVGNLPEPSTVFVCSVYVMDPLLVTVVTDNADSGRYTPSMSAPSYSLYFVTATPSEYVVLSTTG